MARVVHQGMPHLPIIMSGGRLWEGAREADAMVRLWLERAGRCALAPSDLSAETESRTTRENAHYVARLCRARGLHHVALVSCDYHMRRAALFFREEGLEVSTFPAASQHSMPKRLRLAARELAALLADRFSSKVERFTTKGFLCP